MRPISLRVGLIVALVSLVVFLGGAIQVTTLLGTQQAVRSLSRNLVDSAMTRAEDELVSVLNPPLTELARDWARSGLLAPTRGEEAGVLLESLLRGNPLLLAARIADEQGNEIALVRDGGTLRMRETRPDEWGEESRLTAVDHAGDERVATREQRAYDVRTRPWFQGALEQGTEGAAFSSDPYAISESGQFGVTTSFAVVSKDGGRVVAAFDTLFERIQQFVEELEVSENGKVVILTDDGRLVAIPSQALPPGLEPRDWLFRFPRDIESPLLRAASDAYSTVRELGEPRSFRSGGETWWGQVRPVPVPGRTLLVVVLLPQLDLLTDRALIRRRLLATTAGGLGLALIAAFVVGSRFSRPIEALVRNSDRISTGDFERGEAIRTPFSEVASLVAAQDRMRLGLRSLVKLEEDLEVAREIQSSTLPESLPILPGWEFAASNQPADETGGDAYDAFGLDLNWALSARDESCNHAVLLLADATGHGVGPALSVAQLRGMLRGAIHTDVELSRTAARINDQLVADLPSNRFITAWFGLLSERSGTLRYVSAGQAPLLHYRLAGGVVDSLMASAPPLGVIAGLSIKMPPAIELGVGDLFVVLSDGYFEAESPQGEELGVDRVSDILVASEGGSAEEVLGSIQDALEVFTAGTPANDDRTAIVLKRV